MEPRALALRVGLQRRVSWRTESDQLKSEATMLRMSQAVMPNEGTIMTHTAHVARRRSGPGAACNRYIPNHISAISARTGAPTMPNMDMPTIVVDGTPGPGPYNTDNAIHSPTIDAETSPAA